MARPPMEVATWFDPTSTGLPATEDEIARRGYAGPATMAQHEVLEVPPDGHCLFSCAVTARNVARLRSLPQDSSGFMISEQEDRDLLLACKRLRQIVGAMAAEDERWDVLEQLTSTCLPEGPMLTYVANWLGGSLVVTMEGASNEWDMVFGQGPIVCKLLLGTIQDASGQGSPHFRLAGSWATQVTTTPTTPRSRKCKRSRDEDRQDESIEVSSYSSSTEPMATDESSE